MGAQAPPALGQAERVRAREEPALAREEPALAREEPALAREEPVAAQEGQAVAREVVGDRAREERAQPPPAEQGPALGSGVEDVAVALVRVLAVLRWDP